MNEPEARALLNKYEANECTAEEKAVVEEWYIRTLGAKKLPKGIIDFSAVEKEIWNKIDIGQSVQAKREHRVVAERESLKLWPRIVAVSMAWKIAAAVATIVFGIWFYIGSSILNRNSQNLTQNDVKPGKNTAILTLANGKTINLSDAKTGIVIGDDLTYNDGTEVALLSPPGRDAKGREGNNSGDPLSPQGGSLPEGERSRGQTLIASTPRGGTYQITLPDGTKVWLNADSKISFPSQFSDKQRKILLINGEAYFEVSKLTRLSISGKDGRRPERVPFIVESKGQQVEVLGTHFNINAYPDEATVKTTLLEGSVRVAFLSPSASRSSLPRGEMALAREGNNSDNTSLPGGENSVILKPNQQSAISGSNRITVTTINPSEVIDWKNGEFRFKKEGLESILRKLSRWYNVEFVYQVNRSTLPQFSGSVSRFDNVSSILKMLEETGKIKFNIKGRQIYVN